MEFNTILTLELLACCALVLAAWGACLALTYRMTLHDPKEGNVLGKPTWGQRLEAADLIFSLPFYIVICLLAITASIDLMADVSTRWHGVTFCSKCFQLLYVARMSTHCPIQWIVLKSNPTLRLQMTAHHILSIIAYGGGLCTGRCHFWANLDGCCEFTTVFLNLMYAFKWFGAASYVKSQAFVGVMLWGGFIVFRLVLFPVWLWWFHSDITEHPAQTWDQVTVVEKYFYASVTLFLLVISCVWFVPITKGLLKALGVTKTAKKDKAK